MPRYTETEAREAIGASLCYSEALGKLGLRPTGGNHALFRRYVDKVWSIPTDHFDAQRARLSGLRPQQPISLQDVLVADSSYSRTALKGRLYDEGLKDRRCELCGQGELWQGSRMSLILDHINGVPDDNRIANLRIVCPNCAATLDTHCGRKNRIRELTRVCRLCGEDFVPRNHRQRYCSQRCGARRDNRRREPRPATRKVDRPTHGQLLEDLAAMSFVAVGRKYGVSDNAVRKWLRMYKAEAGRNREVEPTEPRVEQPACLQSAATARSPRMASS